MRIYLAWERTRRIHVREGIVIDPENRRNFPKLTRELSECASGGGKSIPKRTGYIYENTLGLLVEKIGILEEGGPIEVTISDKQGDFIGGHPVTQPIKKPYKGSFAYKYIERAEREE